MTQEEIHASFEALDRPQQALLSTFTAASTWISQTKAKDLLAHSGIRESESRQYTFETLRTAFRSLKADGFLEESSHGTLVAEGWNAGLLIEAHRAGFLRPLANTIEEQARSSYRYSHDRFLQKRRLRHLAAMGDERHLDAALALTASEGMAHFPGASAFSFPTFPGDDLLFPHVPEHLQSRILSESLPCAVANFAPIDGFIAPVVEDPERFSLHAVSAAAEALIIAGDFIEAAELARSLLWRQDAEAHGTAAVLHAWLATATGSFEHARTSFQGSTSLFLQGTRKRKAYPPGFASAFALLSFAKEGSPESVAYTLDIAKFGTRNAPDFYQHSAGLAIDAADARTGTGSPHAHNIGYPGSFHLFEWLRCYRQVWMAPEISLSEQDEARLENAAYAAEESGFLWAAYEIETLRARAIEDQAQRKASAARAETLAAEIGVHFTILDCVPVIEPWERHLSGLELLAGKTPNAKKPAQSADGPRISWVVVYHDGSQAVHKDEFGDFFDDDEDDDEYDDDDYYEEPANSLTKIYALQQSPTKSGGWTKGKEISTRRLATTPGKFPFLTPHDLKVISTIEVSTRGWYSSAKNYAFDIPSALHALAGHPAVFESRTGSEDHSLVPAEITEVEPEIRVAPDEKGNVVATFFPVPQDGESHASARTAPGRYTTTRVTAEHSKIIEALDGGGLTIPEKAAGRLGDALAALAGSVRVQSEASSVQASESAAAETVPSDSTPLVRLHPDTLSGEQLEVELCVRPIPDAEIYLAPGTGGATLMGSSGGRPVRTARDLAAESAAATALLAACPALASHQTATTPLPAFTLPTTGDALEALVQLKAASARLVWPKGEPYTVTGEADTGALKVTVKKADEWFAASTEIQVDKQLVLDTKRLLALLDEPGSGRFIEVSEGKFLALTAALRRQLDELRTLGTPARDKSTIQLHPLATGIFKDTFEAAGKLTADKAWKEQVKRFESASAVSPKLPKTLQAELRPYQEEGFRWLVSLAALGAGACLADDMGLGKTIQALALLLHRAKGGPALVVAPTSVVPNWAAEARRFAPTLNVINYSGTKADRKKHLDKLKPNTLVIVSYALLQIDSESFSKIDWHTTVLDEAQAIKNASTKRAKAALALRSDFRIATTGTPVENRLDELFSLFAFLNPGLLGSRERFSQNFAIPIERDGSPAARARLKTLIAPFTLRRLKSAVLEDLPARTETTLHIEMSPEEATFYESLRQRALETLEKDEADEAPEKNSLQILAEITRLRRACCSPALAVKGKAKTLAPVGSKLAAFADLVQELIAGGHRALVFSQFVDHLKILETHLKEQEIPYQYLDGSTPAKHREKRVNTFQSGEGDVFLISLKAGGTGLNLTGADYVIHMDPWWNPAVEDQASDRAHRIGQTRPVTVYRLVMKGSIEEQIVALHHQKRDLADSLLEGTDTAARLTPEDMLNLLRENAQ